MWLLTLAGRIGFVELSPLDITEVGGLKSTRPEAQGTHAGGARARRGLTGSGTVAASPTASSRRTTPPVCAGVRTSSAHTWSATSAAGSAHSGETLRRLWTMFAHHQGGNGAEVDLILSWPGGEEWAVEIKRSLAPKVERGFHAALDDLKPVRALVVYPGEERYRLAPAIEAIGLAELCEQARKHQDSGNL